MLEGTGRIRQGNEESRLKAGTLLSIPPGVKRQIIAEERLVVLGIQVHAG
ncbi:MAG: hypothetical protein AB1497_03470 [Bacillota bacterium]